MMLRAASVAVLSAAAACQAFHVPVVNPVPSWVSTASAQQQQQHHASACCNRSSRQCHRTSSSPLAMTATEEADEKAAAVVDAKDAGGKGGGGTKAAGNTETGVEGALGKGEKKWLNDQSQKRRWTAEERAYLKKMSTAPTLYKRVTDDELYPSVGYDSSFSSLEDSLAQGYSGVSKVTEDGKEKVLMRVVVVGGGEEEGQFVKNLSEKGEGTLVDGLYVLWDPTVGELAETVSNVKFINVHELGSDKTRRPEKVADHANFLAADMIVAVSSQSTYGDDYVPRLKQAALDKGVTFVGPSLAAEVARGEMAAFTKLVEDTRDALGY